MENNNIIDLHKSLESLYLKKDYTKAIDGLLKNRDEFDLGLFHYNLGTLYAKKNDLAYARYNLEMANIHGHIGTKSINNLDYVKTKLAVNDISSTHNLLDQITSCSASISPNIYIFITLLSFLIIALLWLRKKLRSKALLLTLGFFAVSPLLIFNFYINNLKYAVNLKTIKSYEGPSKVYEVKRDIEAGSKFLVSGPKNGWYFIEKPVSLSGYIEKNNLALLK